MADMSDEDLTTIIATVTGDQSDLSGDARFEAMRAAIAADRALNAPAAPDHFPDVTKMVAPAVQMDAEALIDELGKHAAVRLAESLGFAWRGGEWVSPAVQPSADSLRAELEAAQATIADLLAEKRTGEPHIDGWPLYSGLPPREVPRLTDEQLLAVIRAVSKGNTIRLTRDVGPYEVTELTLDATDLLRAVESRVRELCGVAP